MLPSQVQEKQGASVLKTSHNCWVQLHVLITGDGEKKNISGPPRVSFWYPTGTRGGSRLACPNIGR